MKKYIQLLALSLLGIIAAIYTACQKEEPSTSDDFSGNFQKEIILWDKARVNKVRLVLSSDNESLLNSYDDSYFSLEVYEDDFKWKDFSSSETDNRLNMDLPVFDGNSAVSIDVCERNFKQPFGILVSRSNERYSGDTWFKDNQNYGTWGYHKIQVRSIGSAVNFRAWWKNVSGNNGSGLIEWVLSPYHLLQGDRRTYDHGGSNCYGIRLHVTSGTNYGVAFANPG